eukprot:1143989-Pelagomonas_calceolata.AAC.2
MEAATAQHASTMTRLKTRSSTNINRNNKVTLHIILVGVAGTIYNDYSVVRVHKNAQAMKVPWGPTGRFGGV